MKVRLILLSAAIALSAVTLVGCESEKNTNISGGEGDAATTSTAQKNADDDIETETPEIYYVTPSDLGFECQYDADLGGLIVEKYLGRDEAIRIPDEIGGYPVKRITIGGSENLQIEFVIPDGTTEIEERAFMGSGLTSVVIPNSVTTIGAGAFSGCKYLTSIDIPDSVTEIGLDIKFNDVINDYGTAENAGAFGGCVGLTDVKLPDNLKTIVHGTFLNCSSLTKLTIPNSVTYIGACAFYGCSSLKELTIPDSVKTIDRGTFYECSSLEIINIPDGVTFVYEDSYSGEKHENMLYYTFCGCTSLTRVKIPNGVTDIGYCAFFRCTSLAEIIFPDSIKTIGASTFEGCSNLTELILPDGLETAETFAFVDCTELTAITVPASVTEIVNLAFGYEAVSNTSFKKKEIEIRCPSGSTAE